MEVHEHDRIGEKQLRGPHYFSRWYCCMHSDCKTNIVHDVKFKVINEPPWWSEDADNANALEAPRNRMKPTQLIPDQVFWERWRADKVAMKAEGYRVSRGDDGQWIVSFAPVKKLPPGEAFGARDLQVWSQQRAQTRR
jgi:hypothetical protein